MAGLLVVAGCDRVFDLTRPPDPPDAAVDAPDDTHEPCFGTLLVLCPRNLPAGRLDVPRNGLTIDTDTTSCAEYTAADLRPCLVAVETIVIDGPYRVTGSRPLVLVATTSFAITPSGTIDVSSTKTGRGAGSEPTGAIPAECKSATASSNAGGAGGTFGGRGGNGGAGDPGGSSVSPTVTTVDRVRGGCRGTRGSTSGGLGGGGGGAVYLITPDLILDGSINASGAGGRGGTGAIPYGGGGGGGGSGGMIVLDVPAIQIAPTAAVFANGGGGGEGGGNPTTGADGDDPATPGVAALGGAGRTLNGGAGGKGSADSVLSGTAGGTGTSQSGGGGGGGGGGVIRVIPSRSLGGLVSPPPT